MSHAEKRKCPRVQVWEYKSAARPYWGKVCVCVCVCMTLISLNTENCTFQTKNKTREEDRSNKACEGGMDYGKHIKLITVILQGIKIHYLLKLLFF